MKIGNQEHGMFVTDSIDLFDKTRTDVSLTTTAAQSAALDEGVYDIWTTADTYIRIATDASGVTTANGYLLRANNTIPVFVRQNHKIGGILASGTGTLSIHEVG